MGVSRYPKVVARDVNERVLCPIEDQIAAKNMLLPAPC